MTKVYHILRQKSTLFAKIIRDREIIFIFAIPDMILFEVLMLAQIYLLAYQ